MSNASGKKSSDSGRSDNVKKEKQYRLMWLVFRNLSKDLPWDFSALGQN